MRTCRYHDGRLSEPLTCRFFEVGLPRVGSRSLVWAAHLLGLRARHLFGCSECVADANLKLPAGRTDLDLYRSCEYSGNVASVHWERLVGDYPKAKFILPLRPVDDWVGSHQRRARKLARQYHMLGRRPMQWLDYFRVKVFGQFLFDEAVWQRAYERHTRAVRDTVPPDRLLLINVFTETDEALWRGLCGFVGKPVPDAPFPHVRRRISGTLNK